MHSLLASLLWSPSRSKQGRRKGASPLPKKPSPKKPSPHKNTKHNARTSLAKNSPRRSPFKRPRARLCTGDGSSADSRDDTPAGSARPSGQGSDQPLPLEMASEENRSANASSRVAAASTPPGPTLCMAERGAAAESPSGVQIPSLASGPDTVSPRVERPSKRAAAMRRTHSDLYACPTASGADIARGEAALSAADSAAMHQGGRTSGAASSPMRRQKRKRNTAEACTPRADTGRAEERTGASPKQMKDAPKPKGLVPVIGDLGDFPPHGRSSCMAPTVDYGNVTRSPLLMEAAVDPLPQDGKAATAVRARVHTACATAAGAQTLAPAQEGKAAAAQAVCSAARPAAVAACQESPVVARSTSSEQHEPAFVSEQAAAGNRALQEAPVRTRLRAVSSELGPGSSRHTYSGSGSGVAGPCGVGEDTERVPPGGREEAAREAARTEMLGGHRVEAEGGVAAELAGSVLVEKMGGGGFGGSEGASRRGVASASEGWSACRHAAKSKWGRRMQLQQQRRREQQQQALQQPVRDAAAANLTDVVTAKPQPPPLGAAAPPAAAPPPPTATLGLPSHPASAQVTCDNPAAAVGAPHSGTPQGRARASASSAVVASADPWHSRQHTSPSAQPAAAATPASPSPTTALPRASVTVSTATTPVATGRAEGGPAAGAAGSPARGTPQSLLGDPQGTGVLLRGPGIREAADCPATAGPPCGAAPQGLASAQPGRPQRGRGFGGGTVPSLPAGRGQRRLRQLLGGAAAAPVAMASGKASMGRGAPASAAATTTAAAAAALPDIVCTARTASPKGVAEGADTGSSGEGPGRASTGVPHARVRIDAGSALRMMEAGSSSPAPRSVPGTADAPSADAPSAWGGSGSLQGKGCTRAVLADAEAGAVVRYQQGSGQVASISAGVHLSVRSDEQDGEDAVPTGPVRDLSVSQHAVHAAEDDEDIAASPADLNACVERCLAMLADDDEPACASSPAPLSIPGDALCPRSAPRGSGSSSYTLLQLPLSSPLSPGSPCADPGAANRSPPPVTAAALSDGSACLLAGGPEREAGAEEGVASDPILADTDSASTPGAAGGGAGGSPAAAHGVSCGGNSGSSSATVWAGGGLIRGSVCQPMACLGSSLSLRDGESRYLWGCSRTRTPARSAQPLADLAGAPGVSPQSAVGSGTVGEAAGCRRESGKGSGLGSEAPLMEVEAVELAEGLPAGGILQDAGASAAAASGGGGGGGTVAAVAGNAAAGAVGTAPVVAGAVEGRVVEVQRYMREMERVWQRDEEMEEGEVEEVEEEGGEETERGAGLSAKPWSSDVLREGTPQKGGSQEAGEEFCSLDGGRSLMALPNFF